MKRLATHLSVTVVGFLLGSALLSPFHHDTKIVAPRPIVVVCSWGSCHQTSEPPA